MLASGITRTDVFSVATRQALLTETSAPPPMVIPAEDRDVGLLVLVDAADDPVFLGEEDRGEAGVAGYSPAGLVDRADVPAGAEGAIAGAFDQHGMDRGIVRPGAQGGIEAPVHAERRRR